MKKILLIILSLGCLFSAHNQVLEEVGTPYQLSPNTIKNAFVETRSVYNFDRAAGDTVWSNDFSVAADWTAAGPSSNFTTNGWSIGNTTNGWFFANTGNMGTSGDFARFVNGDPNVAGDVVQSGPFTLEYSTPIDLTGVPAPALEFAQYGARFITYQGVEVSTDGGMTWTEVGNNTSIPPLTGNGGSAYGQPEFRRFNIASAIAGNPANVTIRFVWDGLMNGPNTNYVEYGWYIDDVQIIEGASYDAAIEGGAFNSDGLSYYQVPLSQLTAIEFSGEVFNNGALTHTGLNLIATVEKNGNVYTGTSSSINLAPGARDTLQASTLFVPNSNPTPSTGLGVYNVTYTFQGANPDDLNAGNDTIIDAFEVTNSVYARDNGIQSSVITNFASNTGQQFKIGNQMKTFGSGFMNQLSIKVSDDVNNVGKLISGEVYRLTSNGYVLVGSTVFHSVTAANLDNFIDISLLTPIPVQNQDEFLICAVHFGGATPVEFCMAQPTTVGSVQGFLAGNPTPVSLASPSVIMIRANITQSITINQNATICQGSSFTVGSSSYTASGFYVDSLTTVVGGNDSIVNTTLTVLPSYSDTLTESICFGESFTVGNSVYTATGQYTDILQTVNGGCDSTITLNLTVSQAIDVSVSIDNATLELTANASNLAYQWVDCNAGFQFLSGETSQTFMATSDGDYAVILTENVCADTSACTQILGLGLSSNENQILSVYPNPAQNIVFVSFNDAQVGASVIRMTNQLGQIVRESEPVIGNNHQFLNLNLPNGLYFVELTNADKKYVKKVVIAN